MRRVAEDEGIPIYVVSTRSNPLTDAALERVTALSGGRLFQAGRWREQSRAFEAIRDDLLDGYTVTYYPGPSANHGFRRIEIQLVNDEGRRYRVRARPGYRPKSG